MFRRSRTQVNALNSDAEKAKDEIHHGCDHHDSIEGEGGEGGIVRLGKSNEYTTDPSAHTHRTFSSQFRHLPCQFSPPSDQINTSGYVYIIMLLLGSMCEHFQWLPTSPEHRHAP